MPPASQIHCPGCQWKVKINGLLNHVQLSANPLCFQESNAHAADLTDSDTDSLNESVTSQGSLQDVHSQDDDSDWNPFLLQGLHLPARFGPDSACTSDNLDPDETEVCPSLGTDPTGDLYGDYSLLQDEMDIDISSEAEEAIGWLEGDVMVMWELKEDDQDVEGEEVYQAQLEHGLEPEQPVHVSGEEVESDIVEDMLSLVTPADHDGAEEKLCQWPFVVWFPGLAGTTTARTKSGHACYAELVDEGQESPNIYAPFFLSPWMGYHSLENCVAPALLPSPGLSPSQAYVLLMFD